MAAWALRGMVFVPSLVCLALSIAEAELPWALVYGMASVLCALVPVPVFLHLYWHPSEYEGPLRPLLVRFFSSRIPARGLDSANEMEAIPDGTMVRVRGRVVLPGEVPARTVLRRLKLSIAWQETKTFGHLHTGVPFSLKTADGTAIGVLPGGDVHLFGGHHRKTIGAGDSEALHAASKTLGGAALRASAEYSVKTGDLVEVVGPKSVATRDSQGTRMELPGVLSIGGTPGGPLMVFLLAR